MSDFLTAVGLVLAIEGALYALFPAGMRRMVARVLSEPDSTVRRFGLLSTVAGVALVWFIRGA